MSREFPPGLYRVRYTAGAGERVEEVFAIGVDPAKPGSDRSVCRLNRDISATEAAALLYDRLMECVASINSAHFDGRVPDRHSEPILGDPAIMAAAGRRFGPPREDPPR